MALALFVEWRWPLDDDALAASLSRPKEGDMILIRTASGTEYTIRNGRLSRDGAVDMYTPPDMQAPSFTNVPFTNVTIPTVGEAWSFRLAGEKGAWRSSTVTSIDRYCASHDIFGCPFAHAA